VVGDGFPGILMFEPYDVSIRVETILLLIIVRCCTSHTVGDLTLQRTRRSIVR